MRGVPSLLAYVSSHERLPVFPIGGPCRAAAACDSESRFGETEWLLQHAESWGSAFVLTGIDDVTACAAMTGRVAPEGVYARECYRMDPVATPADVAALRTPDPLSDPFLAPSLDVIAAVSRGSRPVLGSVWGPLTIAATLAGVEHLLRATVRDPAFVEALIQRANVVACDYAGAALAHGAKYLWVAEPLAALFGPVAFERFGMPPLEELFAVARRNRAEGILHVCGNTSVLTERLGLVGAAGLSVDANVDLVETAERCPEDMVLFGNLRPVDLLVHSVEDIRVVTREMVAQMAGRPYVAATGCSVPPGTRSEALAAFVDEAGSAPGLEGASVSGGASGSEGAGEPTEPERVEEIIVRALQRYLYDRRHCSELTFTMPCLAFDPDFDRDLIRLANPFGGGIADRSDLCGAVVGGCMALGYFFGRRDDTRDQERSRRLTREYYDWFTEDMGFVHCRDKTGGRHDWDLHKGCAPVVEHAIRHLLEVLRREGLEWPR